MKRLGSFVMAIGFVIGLILAIALAVNLKVGAVPFLVAIGLGKLSFLAAAGVMAVGATLRRLGVRSDQRREETLAAGTRER